MKTTRVEPAERAAFNWMLFLVRISGGGAVCISWMVESRLKHDVIGFWIAAVLGFVVFPTVGYIWTRKSPAWTGIQRKQ